MPQLEVVSAACQKEHSAEDRFYIHPKNQSFGVFDGVGGRKNGDVAAQIAAEETAKILNHDLFMYIDKHAAKQELEVVMRNAHSAVSNDYHAGYTTAVVGIVVNDPQKPLFVYSWVGDSRAYLCRNGKLTHLTLDDATAFTEYKYYQEQIQKQYQHSEFTNTEPEDANWYFSYRNTIYNAVGADIGKPCIHAVSLKPGDTILLCSDGVSDNLTSSQICDILSHPDKLYCTTLSTRIVSQSYEVSQMPRNQNERAKPDDITAIVIQFY